MMATKKQRGGSSVVSSKGTSKTPPRVAHAAAEMAGDLISQSLHGMTTSVNEDDLEKLRGLAERTKATRLARGYTSATEFCLHAGVSKQYLGNIEFNRSKRPEAMPIVKIARTLNVTVDWLLTGEGLPAGEVLDLQPSEFDFVRALREMPLHDKTIVEHIMRPFIQQFGKPKAKAPAKA
jgi:transcriptional regulator with XRE-family HTH domain